MEVTSSWISIGEWYVSKKEIYTMSWDVDLQKNIVIAAPNGGPIAVTRDRTKIVEANIQTSKPLIFLYTASGQPVSQLIYDGNIIAMDWIENERLVTVTSNGTISVYNIFGETLSQNNYYDLIDHEDIIDCRISNSGIVVLTNQFNFYHIELFKSERPTKMADQYKEELDREGPSAWAVVESVYSTQHGSLGAELIVATRNSVYNVDASRADNQLTAQHYVRIVVSPCGKKMACLSPNPNGEQYDLYIYKTDFSSQLAKYMGVAKRTPHALKWVGSEGVMMTWNHSMRYFEAGESIVVPSHDPESRAPVFVVTEIDGLRIISEGISEFFQRVPSELRDIFDFGSGAPSSFLYSAAADFANHDPKADEAIRQIRANLDIAVGTCISAAGYEFSRAEQSRLLKAASFGKCFLDSYNPDAFVATCRSLRVLNAIRHFEIGIPMTMRQYNFLGPETVIRCLIERRKHLLAWRICDYLKIKSDFVLNHWACTKVRTNLPEDVLSQVIIEKLEAVPGISYANIASAAHNARRPNLAIKLLDYEPRAADQVPPLITIGQHEMALNKAIESGDTDLVYLVLLELKRQSGLTDGFLEIVFSRPVALDLLISFCKQKGDVVMLKKIYSIRGQVKETGHLHLSEAFSTDEFDIRHKHLAMAGSAYSQSKDKDDLVYAKLCEDQAKLELLQKELENQHEGKEFLGISLSDTIYQLILLGEHKRVSKIKSEFKVSDRRFWWIKIKALSQVGDWEELHNFAKEKKSPVGYEPFVEVCMDFSNPVEALRYIPKIQDHVNRAQAYLQINYFREAAETAFKEKNLDLLNFIARKCTNPEASNIIDQMRAQLSK
ncbi:hypothetical protein DFA_07142 [Cavenderia fasciculata]|uniref:Vacuolar protein sorting-associated protein 16 homolog n=1 Tax=Cavenderia fasciculata TaxID=261658 RepID=F4PVL2_CACFS|nr:uncharacterized protein DFA_07142 [Cavenderia fasciculata]EGG20026.1 hypothetical protein DFA_07142 [Cavenderia fasciculata]|eukprot:XP_004367009.1 hypothetical protein DFA_07142 [Cavenderia fasciculata]